MSSLPTPLRRQLEGAVKQARKVAEGGARHALEALAVHEPDPYRHMDEAQRDLRRKLRAQAKQLGDGVSQTKRGAYEIKHLVEKLAYDQWHRLLFARFLLENNLLISPEHEVSVTLHDCEELSTSLGLKDAWAVAARFAAKELPEIFRTDDPAGAVELSVNDRQPLIGLVTGLPVEVFTASDSLGWCYQFWQAEKKDEVNAAGNKIGADELPAVTQLFTEDYMVDFLLDNTLGAWHAGKVAAASSRWSECSSEGECRRLASLPGCPWKYLRFIKGTKASSLSSFFNKDEPFENLTGDLPHWRQHGVTYFVTFRCADSLPAEKLEQWRSELKAWLAAHPEPHDISAKEEFYEKFPQRIQYWLDSGYGRCLLKEPSHKKILEAALQHFNGERYDLDEYAVSANHVHVLVTPREGQELSDILHSWKSYTANRINKAEGLSGAFWQKESFDHIVRNDMSLNKFREYIRGHDNQRLEASATSWTPAAGTFDGWPKTAKELTCLDPCMGSGHFVVAMFERLVALRLAEEKLDEAAAVAAVIRDNLFGLEIDPRCTQIGAFNLALVAWRRVGHRPLPAMNLACSGLGPNAKREDWLKLAGDSDRLQRGMVRLYTLFKDAPTLGSLINPRTTVGDLLEADFHELQPLLEKALAQETKDDIAHEMAVTARGLAKAAEILAGQFTLVATNVPYLAFSKQDEELQKFCKNYADDAKRDLATIFAQRCLDLSQVGGCAAVVSPQNWLFLGAYTKFRERLLKSVQWNFVARLGAKAFQTPMWDFNVMMLALTNATPSSTHQFKCIDADDAASCEEKAARLNSGDIFSYAQVSQLQNPDARIGFQENSGNKLLLNYADSYEGIGTGDLPRFSGHWWEIPKLSPDWVALRGTTSRTDSSTGLEGAILWQDGKGDLINLADDFDSRPTRGFRAWGKLGVAINRMGDLSAELYFGEIFECNIAAVIPKHPEHHEAIWHFCKSPEYSLEVRNVDQAIKVTNVTLLKVPFDLAHWQKVAAEKYPHGLPKPFSSDPTQWLFNGHPAGADQPLHVAVARLLGYQWPRQTGSSFPDCPALGPDGLEKLADDDGIVPISPAKGEAAAAERVRELLARAYGKDWNATRQEELLAQVDYAGASLEDWLRNGFFEQHCALFHHSPFIWHVWDGLKNGFSALVNYHKLTHASLEKLTYSTLGNWFQRQQAAVDAGEAGSDAKLQAAKQLQAKLKLILEGEPPYDIFVRWKSLAKQAIGWHPDINDGVRMNIRPFAMADILRKRVKISWGPKADRGKEPKRDKSEYPWFWGWDGKKQDFAGVGKEPDGNRWNDCHYSNAVKQSARASRK